MYCFKYCPEDLCCEKKNKVQYVLIETEHNPSSSNIDLIMSSDKGSDNHEINVFNIVAAKATDSYVVKALQTRVCDYQSLRDARTVRYDFTKATLKREDVKNQCVRIVEVTYDLCESSGRNLDMLMTTTIDSVYDKIQLLLQSTNDMLVENHWTLLQNTVGFACISKCSDRPRAFKVSIPVGMAFLTSNGALVDFLDLEKDHRQRSLDFVSNENTPLNVEDVQVRSESTMMYYHTLTSAEAPEVDDDTKPYMLYMAQVAQNLCRQRGYQVPFFEDGIPRHSVKLKYSLFDAKTSHVPTKKGDKSDTPESFQRDARLCGGVHVGPNLLTRSKISTPQFTQVFEEFEKCVEVELDKITQWAEKFEDEKTNLEFVIILNSEIAHWGKCRGEYTNFIVFDFDVKLLFKVE